jgi:alkylhydroperoxidase family enzyme
MDVRIAPAPAAELGPLAWLIAKAAARSTGGDAPRVFTTLGRHRRLFRAWLPFAATLLLRPHLPRRDVELVVLRTAWNCSSPYEWTQHVPRATRAGLGAVAIASVPAWRDRYLWTARQRLLLGATDELHEGGVVSDAMWQGLSSSLDEREAIELCMLVGHYEMLAMTLNTLGVAPEPSSLDRLDPSARCVADRLDAALVTRTGPASRDGGRPALTSGRESRR